MILVHLDACLRFGRFSLVITFFIATYLEQMKRQEDLVVVTVRIPKSAVQIAKAISEKQSITISEVIRDSLHRSAQG